MPEHAGVRRGNASHALDRLVRAQFEPVEDHARLVPQKAGYGWAHQRLLSGRASRPRTVAGANRGLRPVVILEVFEDEAVLFVGQRLDPRSEAGPKDGGS
jgi:hypothetical protein